MSLIRRPPISRKVIAALVREFAGQVRERVPLAERTWIRVGGEARLYLTPTDVESLQRMLRRLREWMVPVLPLGAGANVVVADAGISTTAVISLVEYMGGIADPVACDSKVQLQVDGGARLSSLLAYCRQHGFSGLEFLAGIPGSAGGAAVMNAGAFGCELSDVLDRVTTCDVRGDVHSWPRGQLVSGYRRGGIPTGQLVIGLALQLEPGDPEKIERQMAEYRRLRRQKQPYGLSSAGSVFKNPPGDFAGRLIDAAGCRGWRCGGAVVSAKHANFITTEPGAAAADVFTLIDRVKEQVRKTFSLELEEEIVRLGDEYPLSWTTEGEELL